MSASEKLKMLDDVRRKDQKQMIYNELLAAAVKTYEVLPQVMAVVKATERASEYANTGYSDKAGAVLRREAAPALAALEQALTNPQGKD